MGRAKGTAGCLLPDFGRSLRRLSTVGFSTTYFFSLFLLLQSVHQPILLCTCCLRCYRLFAPELKLVLELGYLDDRGTSGNHTGNNPTTGGEKLILDWHFQCCTITCNYNIAMPRSSNKLLCTLSPSSTQQESSHRLMKCQSSVP